MMTWDEIQDGTAADRCGCPPEEPGTPAPWLLVRAGGEDPVANGHLDTVGDVFVLVDPAGDPGAGPFAAARVVPAGGGIVEIVLTAAGDAHLAIRLLAPVIDLLRARGVLRAFAFPDGLLVDYAPVLARLGFGREDDGFRLDL
jgi:hypothetical protein